MATEIRSSFILTCDRCGEIAEIAVGEDLPEDWQHVDADEMRWLACSSYCAAQIAPPQDFDVREFLAVKAA